MPVFDYECQKCGAEEKDVMSVGIHVERECRKCGTPMTRRPAVFNPVFIGSGWTRKFYARNGKW